MDEGPFFAELPRFFPIFKNALPDWLGEAYKFSRNKR